MRSTEQVDAKIAELQKKLSETESDFEAVELLNEIYSWRQTRRLVEAKQGE